MKAVNSSGKKSNVGSRIRGEIIGVIGKERWTRVVQVRGAQWGCVGRRSHKLCSVAGGFHGICSNAFGP